MCKQVSLFFCIPLPPPTTVQPLHHTENEACCIWKNTAVKQLSVHSLPFKTKHFIPAVKKPLRFHPLVLTRPNSWLKLSLFCDPLYNCVHVVHHLYNVVFSFSFFLLWGIVNFLIVWWIYYFWNGFFRFMCYMYNSYFIMLQYSPVDCCFFHHISVVLYPNMMMNVTFWFLVNWIA